MWRIINGQPSEAIVLVVRLSCNLPDAFLSLGRDVQAIILLTGLKVLLIFYILYVYFLLKTKRPSTLKDTNYTWKWLTEDVDFSSQFSHSTNSFISSYVNSLSEVDRNRTHDCYNIKLPLITLIKLFILY